MFDSFVAIGDSFTEGLDDVRPDGTYRGWADLVAQRLALQTPGFRYANLAVRGRKLAQVGSEQVPRVEELRPSLVTLAAGGNDLIHLDGDIEALGRTIHGLLERLVGTGATVVVFAGFDPRERIPFTGTPGARGETLNSSIRGSAAELGAVLVDLWHMPRIYERRMWSPDRLHLSGDGHALVAAGVLTSLGQPTAFGDFVDNPEEVWDDPSWLAARAGDAQWAALHLAPWILRRLRGISSGDGVEPKHPDFTLVGGA